VDKNKIMKKLLIIAFVITGCEGSWFDSAMNDNKFKDEAARLDSIKLRQAHEIDIQKLKTDSLLRESQQNFEDVLKWHVAYIDYRQQAQICELKYLRTEDDKYRIQGNRCYDSARRYAILLNKKLKR
jgi:hypothetical protein